MDTAGEFIHKRIGKCELELDSQGAPAPHAPLESQIAAAISSLRVQNLGAKNNEPALIILAT